MKSSPHCFLFLFIMICTSCFDFGPDEDADKVPQMVSGRLLKSCEDPVPLSNAVVQLYWARGTSSIFYESWTHTTRTDINGNFVFSFNEANWGNSDGKRDPYYAELQDSNYRFIMNGIKPEDHELGTIYAYYDGWKIKVAFSVDRSKLLPGDKLEVNRYPSYITSGQGSITDTVFAFATSYGAEHKGPQLANDQSMLELKWEVRNSDTLRIRRSQYVPIDNVCQKVVEAIIDL